mmetsp:Transcript_93228/g.179098  ORF Transcript_93228/g.179098 Transcript_93228/m.179098 type:complete len:259 (-) Transcript_93228:1576-2352(-)
MADFDCKAHSADPLQLIYSENKSLCNRLTSVRKLEFLGRLVIMQKQHRHRMGWATPDCSSFLLQSQSARDIIILLLAANRRTCPNGIASFQHVNLRYKCTCLSSVEDFKDEGLGECASGVEDCVKGENCELLWRSPEVSLKHQRAPIQRCGCRGGIAEPKLQEEGCGIAALIEASHVRRTWQCLPKHHSIPLADDSRCFIRVLQVAPLSLKCPTARTPLWCHAFAMLAAVVCGLTNGSNLYGVRPRLVDIQGRSLAAH